MRMAPPIRTRDMHIPADVRTAGVLILLYATEAGWTTALIERRADSRTHGGQIAFPGGRPEPEDGDLIGTALREAEEEVGVSRLAVEVLGALTEVFIPPSKSLVLPVVGWTKTLPTFIAQPSEVASILEVPLTQLTQPEIVYNRDVRVHTGQAIQAPAYHLESGHVIWGATAMMIAEFLDVWAE